MLPGSRMARAPWRRMAAFAALAAFFGLIGVFTVQLGVKTKALSALDPSRSAAATIEPPPTTYWIWGPDRSDKPAEFGIVQKKTRNSQ